ncbi:hypothetical protein CMV_014734 [Castanea mollissima]|uniref:Uncharacterized protein n=1 Tax=Castanea mollissima TaxID=60419 RepID=A0A8J4QXE5_9ROSI|nr:hypothetical protein CMV_014734 [Castanea mollissima]
MVGFQSDESQALEEEEREGSSSSSVLFVVVEEERQVVLWMTSRKVWDFDFFGSYRLSLFSYDDSIYESFLVLLTSFHKSKGKGQQDMSRLCKNIHDLFKDHPDLFHEFFSFVSNSVPNETTTNESCSFDLQALSQQGNSLFKKIQSCLRGSDYHYNYFLERIHCYTSGHIGLDSVLGSFPLGFVDELHNFIKYCENLGGFPAPAAGVLCESSLGSGQKKRRGSHLSTGCGIGDEVKSSRKGQQWQKYVRDDNFCGFLAPAHAVPALCENSLDLARKKCKGSHMSAGGGGGSGEKAKPSHKGQQRQKLITKDDEDHEPDLSKCTKATPSYRISNGTLGKSLEEPIIVEDYYFYTKHIKCIETHCNVKGDELRENPRRLLPEILHCLRQKLEEFKKDQGSVTFNNYCISKGRMRYSLKK